MPLTLIGVLHHIEKYKHEDEHPDEQRDHQEDHGTEGEEQTIVVTSAHWRHTL